MLKCQASPTAWITDNGHFYHNPEQSSSNLRAHLEQMQPIGMGCCRQPTVQGTPERHNVKLMLLWKAASTLLSWNQNTNQPQVVFLLQSCRETCRFRHCDIDNPPAMVNLNTCTCTDKKAVGCCILCCTRAESVVQQKKIRKKKTIPLVFNVSGCIFGLCWPLTADCLAAILAFFWRVNLLSCEKMMCQLPSEEPTA